jgi:GNAT superfamily N-acetyltransferase
LQRRASLANPADREALLANPDAIVLPQEQVDAGCVIVAERGGVAQGFAVVLPREDGDAELDGLFVEPSQWRAGIGRALVERAALDTRKFGARVLHVVGNMQARGFYESCGFECTGTCETRFGTGLTLERAL